MGETLIFAFSLSPCLLFSLSFRSNRLPFGAESDPVAKGESNRRANTPVAT